MSSKSSNSRLKSHSNKRKAIINQAIEVKVTGVSPAKVNLREIVASLIDDDDVKSDRGMHAVVSTSCFQPTIIADPSMLKLARSVFAPGKTYRFRMSRAGTLTSGSGGGLLSFLSVTPAAFTEYAAISALFDECRLMATRVHVAFL